MNLEQGTHLLKFSATWCGPCKVYGPVFDNFVSDLKDVSIHKIDADENPELLEKFSIRGVPTTVLVKDGVTVKTKTGAMSSDQLKEFLL